MHNDVQWFKSLCIKHWALSKLQTVSKAFEKKTRQKHQNFETVCAMSNEWD